MRFLRRLLRWLGFIHDVPLEPVPKVFDPFPLVPKPEYRKKVPGLPGSKVARRMMKARGLPYASEVYHTGELTEANNERSSRRVMRNGK